MADERVAQLMASGRLLLLHWRHFNDLEGLPERGFQDVSQMEGRGWKGATSMTWRACRSVASRT